MYGTARQTSTDSARATSRLSGPFITPAEEGPREDTPRRARSLLQAVSLQEAQEGQAPTIYRPSIDHLSTIYRPSIDHLSTIMGAACTSCGGSGLVFDPDSNPADVHADGLKDDHDLHLEKGDNLEVPLSTTTQL